MMQDELENLKFTSENHDVPQSLHCDEGNIEGDEPSSRGSMIDNLS